MAILSSSRSSFGLDLDRTDALVLCRRKSPMSEGFPKTVRAPASVRVGASALALLAMALAARTTLSSLAPVGHVFPGFVLLDNRVIASIGLAHWSGSAVRGLYQSELVAVEGQRVASTAEAYRAVRGLPAETMVRYRLRRDGTEREVTVQAQTFTIRDWVLLHGAFLLNGVVFLASGIVTWVMRPQTSVARALLAVGGGVAVFLFTALDLYGPGTFFRLHVLAESVLPGAFLHLALVFPRPGRFAHLRFVGYALSLGLAIPYQILLYQPAEYSRVLRTSMLYLGIVAIVFCSRLIVTYWRDTSQLARQRVRVITLGGLFAFAVPAIILPLAALTAGSVAMNPAAVTPFIFAVALAYAIVKHDLFEIDAMVKRGAYYLALTGTIAATYLAAVLSFNLILQASAITDSLAFPVLFTLAVLLLFNPLRNRLQSWVDRVFFGTVYDGREVLARIGQTLAGALERERIARLVRDCVESTIPNEGTGLFEVEPGGGLREVDGGRALPPVLATELAGGRVRTIFDPPELYGDARVQETVRSALESCGATIAVPLRLGGELVGAITAGAKHSRLFYTAGDAEFLQGLAHEVSLALRNAASYERVIELNAGLEERVHERTSQLEKANRQLGSAYEELQRAEVQLVHSEKMASLGRLVAGVAHEINNPVTFVSNSIPPLRRRLAKAAETASANETQLLREADDLAQIIGRGAERTATIVRDLRTFSRLDEAPRKPTDLNEGLEVTLQLLEQRWRDRIVVHRDYGELPLVECDAAGINQVFTNILANACDAIPDRGNLWIRTSLRENHVTVMIRDDGQGIPREVRGRIFDPFFTTKDVGHGTGLGLAISHGVVSAHDGRISVESDLGSGTTFEIALPTKASLDRAGHPSG